MDIVELTPREAEQPLEDGEVRLWLMDLTCDPEDLDFMIYLLSEAERERAAKFTFDDLRRRFIVRRATLRHILGFLVGVAPPELAFSYNDFGKPRLEGVKGLNFNQSSSGDWALLACAKSPIVGVDIEQIRPMDDADDIVKNNFSDQEFDQWSRLPPDCKNASFFVGWTRKEAVVKALGDGLSRDLKGFSVSFDQVGKDIHWGKVVPSTRWSAHYLGLLDGLSCALVCSNDMNKFTLCRI